MSGKWHMDVFCDGNTVAKSIIVDPENEVAEKLSKIIADGHVIDNVRVQPIGGTK